MDSGFDLGRVKKGERIIVPILSEPIQELIDQFYKCARETKDLGEELEEQGGMEKAPMEIHKKFRMAEAMTKIKREEMWLRINESYNTWNIACGIRRGYCLVDCTESMKASGGMPPEVKQIIKMILKDMGGEE